MTVRITLSYWTSSGEVIRLFNLLPAGADDIVRAQRQLGSHGFTRYAQGREYGDLELAFLRRHPIHGMGPFEETQP